MQVASVKVEADHESTETATMIITCTRMGCRRPVRKELLDDDSMPMCDEHQGLFRRPSALGGPQPDSGVARRCRGGLLVGRGDRSAMGLAGGPGAGSPGRRRLGEVLVHGARQREADRGSGWTAISAYAITA